MGQPIYHFTQYTQSKQSQLKQTCKILHIICLQDLYTSCNYFPKILQFLVILQVKWSFSCTFLQDLASSSLQEIIASCKADQELNLASNFARILQSRLAMGFLRLKWFLILLQDSQLFNFLMMETQLQCISCKICDALLASYLQCHSCKIYDVFLASYYNPFLA